MALWERNPKQGFDQELVTPGDFADWRDRTQSFEQLAFSPAWPGARTVKLIGKDGAERVSAAYVSANYFDVLGVSPLLGRAFLPNEDLKANATVAGIEPFPLAAPFCRKARYRWGRDPRQQL